MKIYTYKNGEIATFENNEKVSLNGFEYLLENSAGEYSENSLFNVIEREIAALPMEIPSVSRVLEFATKNNCELKVINKEVSGYSFEVEISYINSVIKGLRVSRNGTVLGNYKNDERGTKAIEALRNQLGITF